MTVSDDLPDDLLNGCKRPEDRLGGAGFRVRDIEAPLAELDGLGVSPGLICRVIGAVPDEVRGRQRGAQERVCPIVIVDALRVNIRDADIRGGKSKAVSVGCFTGKPLAIRVHNGPDDLGPRR